MHNNYLIYFNKLFIAFILPALIYSGSAIAVDVLDSIAVIVNDDVITSRELEKKVNYYENQIRLSNGSISDRESLRK